MIDAPIGFAFAAGAVAAFNPCGFALLPAYLSFFLGADGAGDRGSTATLRRALAVTVAVSLGFVVVFGLAGLAISSASFTVQRYTPWISLVIGLALVPLGVAMAWGWKLNLTMPRWQRSGTGSERGLLAMGAFGVSYAIVSLSCAIPAFLVAVVSTFEDADVLSGVTVFLAYSAGMAAVLGTLTVFVALAQGAMVARLRRVLPYVQRTAGGLLVVAGLYVAYYGWFDIQAERGNTVAMGPIDTVGSWSGRVTEWVDGLGNGPVVGVGAALAAVTVGLAIRARRGSGA